jgi:hypothetical protein
VIVKLNVLTEVGIPVMAPELLKFKPDGNVPLVTAKVYGAMPPKAKTLAEYGESAVALANVVGDKLIVGDVITTSL